MELINEKWNRNFQRHLILSKRVSRTEEEAIQNKFAKNERLEEDGDLTK